MSHELCHLFGLSHCYYFQCAMNESGSISEASGQPLFLCPVCFRKLNRVQRMDLAQRYSNMLQVKAGTVKPVLVTTCIKRPPPTAVIA